jgi:hypothetical protein
VPDVCEFSRADPHSLAERGTAWVPMVSPRIESTIACSTSCGASRDLTEFNNTRAVQWAEAERLELEKGGE